MVEAQRVVLFDGVCNLCNSSVNFISDRDKKQLFKFAALQSKAAAELLKNSPVDPTDLDSVVLVEGDNVYTESTAVLRISRFFGVPYNLGYLAMIIPRPVRDFFYKLVAKNRYKMFGKQDACRVPTPELKARFLADDE